MHVCSSIMIVIIYHQINANLFFYLKLNQRAAYCQLDLKFIMDAYKSAGSALFISDCDRANLTAHKRLQIDSCISPYKLNYKSVLAQRTSAKRIQPLYTYTPRGR